MKLIITLGVVIVGTLFGWFGALMDHGNWFGGWSLFLSSIGSLIGVWLGYKIYQLYF